MSSNLAAVANSAFIF